MQRLTAWRTARTIALYSRWRPVTRFTRLPAAVVQFYSTTTPADPVAPTAITITEAVDPAYSVYRDALHSENVEDLWKKYQHVIGRPNAAPRLTLQDFVDLRSKLWKSKDKWGVEENVLQVLNDMKRLGHPWTILEYNEYFSVKLFQAKYQEILDTFQGEFHASGLKPTIGTFNVLLATYLQRGQTDDAIDLIRTARARWGVVPDIRDFQRTMHRCLPRDNAIGKQARDLITEHCLTQDLDALNTNLVHMILNRTLLGDAKYIYMNVKDRIVLDMTAYGLLIRGFMDGKQPREAFSIYEDMQKAGLKADPAICMSMLTYFAHNRDVESAERIVKEVVDGGYKLDEMLYNQLLRVYLKSGNTPKALQLFELIQRDPKLKMNDVIVNTLMDGLLANREIDATKLLYQQMMKDPHIKPDMVTFNTLMKGFVRLGDYPSAVQVISDMQKLKFEPDIVTMTTMLDGLFGQLKSRKTEDILGYLQRAGMKPNIYTFNAIISKYVKNEEMPEAERAFQMLRKFDIKPTIHTFSSLIQGYVAARDLDSAMLTFQKILRSGLKPDRASYHFIICGFLNHNRLDDAVTCLQKMRKDKCLPTKDTLHIMMDECIRKKDWKTGAIVVRELEQSKFAIRSGHLLRAYETIKKRI
ncbi:hypothetical protein BX666DRAFT_1957261 [Dichotomocladium elegans]|nr:hypothetical protein BX666DRAFT_1957261 [Dichotomocladium elegans]